MAAMSAADVKVTIKGLNKVSAKLRSINAQLANETERALAAEAEIEMTEAKRRTPVLTGVLRASGHVQPVLRKGDVIEASLVFGGPAAPYAVAVHENEEAFHKVGQAKFLSSVLYESAPFLASRVAARVKRMLAGVV